MRHPVFPADGQHRAGLDHDLKNLDLVTREIQQAAGEDQVTGGRDGQELRQTFDDAHDDDFDGERNIHAGEA